MLSRLLVNKKRLLRLFLWSWLVTLPIAIVGGYLSYKTVTRFYTFTVRYDPHPAQLSLSDLARYEWDSLCLSAQSAINRYTQKEPALKSIYLFAAQADIAKLERHLPQSGYDYIKGALLADHKLIKAKIRYRGDFTYHWAWHKKSLRVKTSKDHLFYGLRTFNLLAPQFPEQLNNYLAYQLATHMGLLAPRTDLVQVYLNGEDRGVHILVEQLSEMTLRHKQLMPSDIYRGELYGKDAFVDSSFSSLFSSANVWDKVAVNNHYPQEAKKPLERLVALLADPDSQDAQQQLSQLLDMQAWARFSVFESLIQSWHYDDYHNWRLSYDPWTQKLVPIVWDPIGWAQGWEPHQSGETVPFVMSSHLHKVLFKNGDFLRARYKVAHDFFSSEKESDFLEFVDNTVAKMQQAIRTDPALNTPDIEEVKQQILAMQKRIVTVFSDLKSYTTEKELVASYQYQSPEVVNLFLYESQVVQRVLLSFDQSLSEIPKLQLAYEDTILDLSGAVTLNQHQLQINAEFLPGEYQLMLNGIRDAYQLVDVMFDYGDGWQYVKKNHNRPVGQAPHLPVQTEFQEKLAAASWKIFYDTGHGFNEQESRTLDKVIEQGVWCYQVTIPRGLKEVRIDLPAGLFLQLSDIRLTVSGEPYLLALEDVRINDLKREGRVIVSSGQGDPYFFFDVRPFTQSSVTEVTLTFNVAVAPEKIYRTVAVHSTQSPLVWKGDIFLEGINIIERPLFIQPGTRVLLAEKASLIVKNRLLALGSKEQPIQFVAQKSQQKPWGAIVLMGPLANESVLQHCEFAQGSGLKADLYEYTGMLSVHDVQQLDVSDCLFRDNHLVDDMVHVVYSHVDFQRNHFVNAFADALDIDISTVNVSDSIFENSGNDAIDLMSSEVNVLDSIFRSNGDKGISVGEESQLLALNNVLRDNIVGIQVKDRSRALLFNQSLFDNKTALAAFKKNWRYGQGGLLVLSKSVLAGNKVNMDIQKQSKAFLFDSAIEGEFTGKRIRSWLVDTQQGQAQVTDLLAKDIWSIPELSGLLAKTSEPMFKLRYSELRGAHDL